ncbi:large ribosomal subunit protein mL49-like isoform X2 [Amphiura filiformis]|uniref:large ribosomal subunit protein mL49-like isoform X2 n=1 Tax=Amphiura filiformis TaxID=82378 RepID=UPI003B221C4C
MAASSACSACIFRLAKCILSRLHPHTAASTPTQCRHFADLPPNFYPSWEKVKEEEPRTGVEVSTAEWKYVERLIPPLEPPPLPKHESYPTPSGFMPPTGASPDTPYHVRRTRFHSIPVFREEEYGGTRQLTLITRVDGDIWALAKEVKDHLQETVDHVDMEIPYQVNEYTRKIWFKGIFVHEIRDFIQNKGF